MLHAGVTHAVLKCNDFKTLFAESPIRAMSARMLLAEATAGLRSRRHRMAAGFWRAMTASFDAGASTHELEACTQRFSGSVHPYGDSCCWCMTELSRQLQLLSAIGTDQEDCPMVLGAADSTLETMLSLSVANVNDGAGASPSPSRAIATAGGVSAVRRDDVTISSTRQATVQPC